MTTPHAAAVRAAQVWFEGVVGIDTRKEINDLAQLIDTEIGLSELVEAAEGMKRAAGMRRSHWIAALEHLEQALARVRGPDFKKVAEHVMDKNAELYRKLAGGESE
jgi:hypothetical protein